MRFVLFVTFLTGCIVDRSTDETKADPVGCLTDGDCAGDVCARDATCRASSDVRVVHVRWTVATEPASVRCSVEHVRVGFAIEPGDTRGTLGFEPVPCGVGLFSVNKLPIEYQIAGVTALVPGAYGMARTIDANGEVALDLPR